MATITKLSEVGLYRPFFMLEQEWDNAITFRGWPYHKRAEGVYTLQGWGGYTLGEPHHQDGDQIVAVLEDGEPLPFKLGSFPIFK